MVPVFNTERYINRCLDSLVDERIRDDIEILVVSDGSKDHSVEIVQKYVELYPDMVKLVEKENGGHGSTINKGLEIATGKYFRVLDSDDWFYTPDFILFVERLKKTDVDLVVCNYRKEYVYDNNSEYFEYKGLKENQIYTFDEFDLNLLCGEYFVMATSTFKTDVLRKSKLHLLEKTFYVDMQYNIVPIRMTDTFMYFDLDVYRYFIGRQDQSTETQNVVKNQEHHDRVVGWLISYYEFCKNKISDNKRLYIEQILIYLLDVHYSIYCRYDENKKSAYRKVASFDKYLLKKSPILYEKLNALRYIKYNRKTGFVLVRLKCDFLYKMVGKFLRH